MGKAGVYWFERADGGELENPRPRAVLGGKVDVLGRVAYLLESRPLVFGTSLRKTPVAGVVVGVFGWVRSPAKSWALPVLGVTTDG